ncbi:tetratricopeptide repeat protein [Mycobacterium sp. URHB0021]
MTPPVATTARVHSHGDIDVTAAELQAITAEAKSGDVAMQNVLGTIFFQRGDLDRAEQWLRTAALAGHYDAAYNLGVLFLNDRANEPAAERWWQHASAGGHAGAKHALGILCYQREDMAGAKRWWVEAARAGDQDSIDKLEILLAD